VRSVELPAHAKLNLYLEVLGRRPDGYHEIDSIAQEISLHDTVVVERARALSLEVEGDAPRDRTNLAWKAAEALGLPARIRLRKRIPAGAGLGGGSSDAAAVLRGLSRLYGAEPDPARLSAIAASLGADVPFFLSGGLARLRGIGDRVEPLPRPPPVAFLLACPAIVSRTPSVYGALGPGLTGNPDGASLFLESYLGESGPRGAPYFNRLQPAAERLLPALRAVREELGRRFGRDFTLTGSGAAYFAPAERSDRAALEFESAGIRVRVWRVDAKGA
jgi:4-diphosphocytidyl-2-C-methyl-D-erythritol kinase